MFDLLAEANRLLFAPPLLVGVSLVYAATRHEDARSIIRAATSFGVWTAVFMAGVAALLQLLAAFQ